MNNNKNTMNNNKNTMNNNKNTMNNNKNTMNNNKNTILINLLLNHLLIIQLKNDQIHNFRSRRNSL
jgi:hypothetical protein